MNLKLLQDLKSLGFIVLFAFFSQYSYSQLTDFTLNLTKTNETCTGNGSLSFNVTGMTAGGAMVYSIYQLPNLSTPIATTSGNTYGGLAAGTYRVIATQTLGSSSNFQQQDITIFNTVSALQYQLVGRAALCGNGQIKVNVSAGNPVSYETISGPVIIAPQSSNVLANLVGGVYVVRVNDACGDAVVQTFTLMNASLVIGGAPAHECALLNCGTAQIQYTLAGSNGAMISYPFTVQYTVFPPTGAPIVSNQTVSSGTGGPESLSMGIPFYYGQSYSYNVRVTDHCGNTVSSNNNAINEVLAMQLTAVDEPDLCSKDIKVEVCNFLPPYTVSFLSAPAGFNPSLYNVGHPGPFTDEMIVYETTASNHMPFGTYTIKVTDACGRSVQSQITLLGVPEPGYSVQTGCGSGKVTMPNTGGSPVASVIMTSAPSSYPHALPYDVSFNITDGHFEMSNLPTGTYTFTVVSICGITYNYTVVIPLPTPGSIYSEYRRGCAEGEVSVKLSLASSSIVSVIITAAPSTFLPTLPNDVSYNLFMGIFYMNSLPEGIYTFKVKDGCGFERSFSFNIPGYHVLVNNIVVQQNCGSFNIAMDYQSNEPTAHQYWLQKFDTTINQWVHPITGVVYPAGSFPTISNSYELINNTTNLNIASIGTFRILKTNFVFANGDLILNSCVQNVKDFIFTGGPRIVTAYSLPCASSAGNVEIVAQGLAPLNYSITTKDNAAFVVNNLTSSTFTGLQPGIYNFQVKDLCGNIVNRLFDLTAVPQPSISQSNLCSGQNGQLSVQNFTFLNYQWWKGTSTTVILSTTNTLNFTPFNGAVDPGTYYVRIYSNVAGVCTDQTVSYVVPVPGSSPNAGDGTITTICGNSGSVDLNSLLTGPFMAGGTWQEISNSGNLVGHNWLPVGIPFGTYLFKYTVNGLCGSSDDTIVEIHLGSAPATPTATADLLICDSGSFNLSASSIANATYQWTGPNGFTSSDQNPVITAASILSNGTYTVKAIVNGCSSATSSVLINVDSSPKFTIDSSCTGIVYNMTVVPVASSFSASGASYSWSGPNNYASNSNPAVIPLGAVGEYTVVVTSANNCSTTQVLNVQNTLCAFPLGISPNGDNANESYDLTGYDVIKFKIFSRWGRMVYEQNDYTNQWHGQDYNDNELPDATYYYYVRLKSGEEKTGWVYVTK